MPGSVPAPPQSSRFLLAGALALLGILALAVSAATSYTSALRWIDHANDVQRDVDAWELTVGDVQNDVSGYIATNRPVFVERRGTTLDHLHASTVALLRLVADNPLQSANVAAAGESAKAVLAHLERQMTRVREGHREEALAVLEQGVGMRLMAEFRQAIGRIRAEEQRLLVERRRRAAFRGKATLLSGTVFALASLGLLSFAWSRQTRHEHALARLAKEARERLRVLSELAEALASARTTDQVAKEVSERGRLAAHGDTCTLYALNDAGNALELLATSGVAPEILSEVERLTPATHPSTFADLKSARSVWVESETDYRTVFPNLAKLKATGNRAKAFWSVPLIAEGRPLGLLGVGYYAPRQFSQDERVFIDTLAHQCAQALLRASRMEREDEARRWLGTTLRSIGDAVIATDSDGRITFMNPVAESLTGWTEAEALAQPLEAIFKIFSEATRAPVESPVTKVLREGKVVGLANHTVLRPKSGPEIPIDDSGAPILNEQGAIVGVVLVFRDVSHEKRDQARNEFLARAGEALASSLDYQATLATVARFAVPQLADWCGVDLLDPTTGKTRQVAVAHIDPAKVQLARELGQRFPPDANATTGVPEVVRTGRSELYREIPEALLEAGARGADHLRILRELKLKSAMVVALRTHTRIFGAMSFVYADSERRYTEADLSFAEELARRGALAIENSLALQEAEDARARERYLRDEAERANRAKDDFLATVSHELRTPLNAILGWTVNLRSRRPAAEIDRGLSIVERNARAQAKLIEDVLDVSRVISGKLALSLGPTDVAGAVRAAIETVTPAAEAKGVTLSSTLAENVMPILADANRLQQIAWNLLSNAVKFTPPGGRVAVGVSQEGSDVCLSVTDSGEGIRPEHLALIFEPFQQADASTTRRHGGLGLGLSIVKQLVFAHGGTAKATSDGPGRGSTFTVRLPARTAIATFGSSDEAARAQVLALSEPTADVRLDGLRVLIVDDEPDSLALLEDLLRQRGAAVDVAPSAAVALEKFTQVKPDVLVSDISMPGEDGYTLIKKVRALPVERGGRTPAVALTAYARPADAQRAFSAGYQVHVTKPLEPTRLASVVANLGGRSQGD
jgi:PAS domain S-box-containing protein